MTDAIFGTDGIRGVAGQGHLAPDAVVRVGAAIGAAVADTLPEPEPGIEGGAAIVIGRDTRASGPEISAGLCRGLQSQGAFIVDLGEITTPGLAYMTGQLAANLGVVVSASHNPAGDNGVKLFSPAGSKVDEEFEHDIEQRLAGFASTPAESFVPREGTMVQPNPAAVAGYVDALVTSAGGTGAFAGMRVALDCANGAASAIAPAVFAKLGCDVVAQAAAPDGNNINSGVGSQHPEALAATVAEAAGGPFDLGVVLDGDADRCVLIDEAGNVRDGDYILYVWARELAAQGELVNDTVVSTTMANIGLELALADDGIMLVRTDVGDRNVAQSMFEFGSVLGGEQSGHICHFGGDSPIYTGDGIRTAMAIARVMRQRAKSLGELCVGLSKVPQTIENVHVNSKPPLAEIAGLEERISVAQSRLGDAGRVVVRYSGTEPLLRVMVESADAAMMAKEAGDIAAIVRAAVGA